MGFAEKKNTKYCQKIVVEHISVSEAEDLEDKSVDSDSEKAGNKKQEVPPKDQGSKRWRLTFAQCMPCVAGQHGGYCQHVFALLLTIEAYAGRTALLSGG